MVSKTPWLETEGRRRLPHHRQRLGGALQGRKARPASLLLQHRELRSRRFGRETEQRRAASTTPQASEITAPPMRSRDSKPPALHPGAKTDVCISTIRTASNVRSQVRDLNLLKHTTGAVE